jgi:hypothetical protein
LTLERKRRKLVPPVLIGTNLIGWSLAVCQVLLSGALLAAATGKVLRPDRFAAALRLSHVPASVVGPVQALVPMAEFAIATLVVVANSRGLTVTLVAATALIASFTAWMLWVLSRGLRVSCACFGGTDAAVRWSSVLRNVLLGGAAIVGAVLSERTVTKLPSPSVAVVVFESSLALAFMLALAARSAMPYMVLTKRGEAT